MSKAILILDEMPKNCGECKLYMNNGNSYWCKAAGIDTTGFTIPASCPLKPMPKKKEVKKIMQPKDFIYTETQYDIIANKIMEKINYDVETIFNEGYNSCLDEILGEEHE